MPISALRITVTPVTTGIFEPAELGPITLRNRVVKSATFEGMARGGLVSDSLIDFHRAQAAGGVAMTTLAYCAVSPEGRGAPHEIVLREEAVEGLSRLAEAVHEHGTAISAQIGHAGPVGNWRVTKAPALSASSGFSPLGTRHHAMTDHQIAKVVDDFANGARVLARSGFDAVEIHMGHHYLLNSFLSPRLNRRRDQYGGSVENRARLARTVAMSVREAAGDRLAVIAKWEMVDGIRGGLQVEESVEAAKLVESDGALDALELTGGGSLANPMYLFRGDVPRREFAATLPRAQRLGFHLVGRLLMRRYPFSEAYFLPLARRFRSELKMPLILLGGINRLETMQRALEEGFGFVALGRALLREPDLVNRLKRAEQSESRCIHCNKCVPTIYSGTHCVLVAPGERPGLSSASRGSG
jgi:2,4-dienoyl-CoA reductase-like NADH-dependent reductase (Old Yellow Enzyme family)